jgi:hypothetical protein
VVGLYLNGLVYHEFRSNASLVKDVELLRKAKDMLGARVDLTRFGGQS